MVLKILVLQQKIGVNNFYCFSNKMHPIHISPKFHPPLNCHTLPRPFTPPQNEFTTCNDGRGTQIFGTEEKVPVYKEKSIIEVEKNQNGVLVGKTRIGKENYSPIIIKQRKQEKRSCHKMIIKRSINSFTPDVGPTKNSQLHLDFHTPLRINPFPRNDSLVVDSYCSKMSESIILNKEKTENQNPFPQTLKFSHFKKIKFLGRGKFGQVYLVMHIETGFICAMKIIEKQIIKQQKMIGQLAKEIRIHNVMRNLNIIQFYGFFDDDKSLYLLLQYACQGSLYSKLKGKNRLEESEIKPIVKQICQGVQYIHRMGYIHRDLKPENIVMQFGIPKVCDFGWATVCFESQLCRSYCGTPLYLAPQMVKKQKYTNSIDVWSIGLLTYEILVGRGPFGIWSENDLNRILETQISYPQYIDRSEICESFIKRCLQKVAERRISMDNVIYHPFICEVKCKELQFEFYDQYARVFNIY